MHWTVSFSPGAGAERTSEGMDYKKGEDHSADMVLDILLSLLILVPLVNLEKRLLNVSCFSSSLCSWLLLHGNTCSKSNPEHSELWADFCGICFLSHTNLDSFLKSLFSVAGKQC